MTSQCNRKYFLSPHKSLNMIYMECKGKHFMNMFLCAAATELNNTSVSGFMLFLKKSSVSSLNPDTLNLSFDKTFQ